MKLAVIGTVTSVHAIEGAYRIHQAIVSCGDEGTWSGVVGKDINLFSRVIVFLQDAILQPSDRWEFMELHKWRVRMTRFKGVPSECVIVKAEGEESLLLDGSDVTEMFGVTKYEKPIPAAIAGDVRGNFPSFIPKTDEPNFQRVRDLEELMHGSDWVATLQYDGTSCTVWNDDDGMHVCSRNLELKEFTASGTGNVYWQAARKFGLERLPHGFALQFEVVGPGIQANPMGLTELEIAAFTLYNIGGRRRAHFGALVGICQNLEIPMASIVAAGSGFPGHDAIRDMSSAAEYGEKTPGEGLVFRDVNSLYSFKAISLDYKN
jgi:RNA ligase (TIGR02306 family)